MAKNPLQNPWGDGRNVDALEPDCAFRPCLQVGEDKGSYVQGRGYTSYYKNPKLVCMRRHLRGCPYPIPEVDVEDMRCCLIPSFAPKGKRRPQKQKCQSCGTFLPISQVDRIRDLPALPHVKCNHVRMGQRSPMTDEGDWWYCPACNLWWKTKPEPFQKGMEYGEVLDVIFPSLAKAGKP